MFQVAGGAIGLGLCTAIFTIRSEDEIASDAAALGLRDGAEQSASSTASSRGPSPERARLADFSTSTAERVLGGGQRRSSPGSSSAA